MSEPPHCCICLDEFTRPASLPCGHLYCLECIGDFWRVHGACQCPLCKAFYPTRPQLNTGPLPFVPTTEEDTAPLKSGEVICDLCTVKRRAVRSCPECMASYCSAHLEPHYQDEDLGRHLLIDVVKNTEDCVCKVHGKQLNRFCRSDRTCICVMCAQTDHRGHHVISVNREAARTKVKLKRRKLKLQQGIQDKISTIEKMKLSADFSETKPRNKELIEQLEEGISELQRRNTELESLFLIEDNLRFLQRFLHTTSTQ